MVCFWCQNDNAVMQVVIQTVKTNMQAVKTKRYDSSFKRSKRRYESSCKRSKRTCKRYESSCKQSKRTCMQTVRTNARGMHRHASSIFMHASSGMTSGHKRYESSPIKCHRSTKVSLRPLYSTLTRQGAVHSTVQLATWHRFSY